MEMVNLKKLVMDEVVAKLIPEDVLSKVRIGHVCMTRYSLLTTMAVHDEDNGRPERAVEDTETLHCAACVRQLHVIRPQYFGAPAISLPHFTNDWVDVHDGAYAG